MKINRALLQNGVGKEFDLQFEAGFFCHALEGTGAEEYGAGELAGCDFLDCGLVFFHGSGRCGGNGVYPGALLLDLADVGDE